MLGIMNKDTEAKPGGQPSEDVPQLNSHQEPSKVKSSTITMFFKSPPKQQAKPVIRSPNLLGYFRPTGDTNVEKSNKDSVNKAGGVDEGSEDGGSRQTKGGGNKRTKNGPLFGVIKEKGAKKANTAKIIKSKSTENPSPADKIDSKIKSKSSYVSCGKKNADKTLLKDCGLKGADLSADDFDNSKPVKNKKTKPKHVKQSKTRKLVVNNDQKEPILKKSEEELSINCNDVAQVKSKEDSSIQESQSSNVIPYSDYIKAGDTEKDKIEDGKTPASVEDDYKTEDTHSLDVIPYAQFMSHTSEDEDNKEDIDHHAGNDNDNNHQSQELSDDDMADAAFDESVVSMDTGATSDEDVFQDCKSSLPSQSQDTSKHSSSDAVITISPNACPKPQQLTEMQPSMKVKNKKVALSENKSAQSHEEKEEKSSDEMCLPKRREVKVTVQVHTPPAVVSPSASPGQSPAWRNVISNVVVEATDLDLEVIHVENSDNNPQNINVSSFSGASTPTRDTSSNGLVQPVPTKLFSIFQNKSVVKESSKLSSNGPKDDKREDSSKITTNEGNQSDKVSKQNVSLTKKTRNRTKSNQAKTTERKQKTNESTKEVKTDPTATKLERKLVTDQDDLQKDNNVARQSRSKLSLGKRKTKSPTPEPRRRRSSGRAAAIKARKDILEQELREEFGGSESGTSQEDILPPRKRPLKDLFPSATDTEDDKKSQSSGKKKKIGKQTKLKQGKILTKQTGRGKGDVQSPGRRKKIIAKRNSSGEDCGTCKEGMVMRRRSPKVQTLDEKSSKKMKGPISTSSPKINKGFIKNSKARQLLQKAKTRQSTSPSKPKKSRKKNEDSIVVLDSSNEEKPAQTTKILRNFTDVLGKKVISKELDVKEKEVKKVEKKVVLLDKRKKQEKRATVKSSRNSEMDAQDKVPTNICPLFTKEGRLAAAKKQAEMIRANSQDSSQDTLINLSDEDSCDSRVSNSGSSLLGPVTFSGLFSSSKRSDQERKTHDLPYPAFPSVSHVLQKDNSDSLYWNLPRTNLPPMIKQTLSPSPVLPLSKLNIGVVTMCSREEIMSDFDNLKEFSCHAEFSFETQKVLLEDIGQSNPKISVRKHFKKYLAKKKGDPPLKNISTTDNDKSVADSNKKFTKLRKGRVLPGKRKSEAISDEAESVEWRKRSRQDQAGEEKDARGSRLRRSGRSQQLEPKELRRSKRKSIQDTDEVKGQIKGTATDDSKANSDVKEKDEATLKAEKLASMLWTEKYQPSSAVEVMGNNACVKKLSGWLAEWKKKFLKEKKKMKKQQMKGVAKKHEDKENPESDSDFEMSDSDTDDGEFSDDEDFLCNTMLVTGPSGAGKTAAVYACAQEHGFKVFEVNASSRRGGRQLLAQLGEVTQSHHVAARPGSKTSINSFFTPAPKMSPSKSPAKRKAAAEQRKKPPIPKAFANFFKTTAGDDKKQSKDSPKNSTKNQPGKKKKANEDPPAVTLTTKKKIDAPVEKTIPSTSIIVFEEVDVIFEEDKGFLAAIASFMETTKRPIILITSDPKFASNFEGQYETLLFKRPSPTTLATHLQLLSLAENVFTSPQDMKLVAQHLDCDIRRSVLALQYWISSGAKRNCIANKGNNFVAKVTSQNSVSRHSHKVEKQMDSSDQNSSNQRTDKMLDMESKIEVIKDYHGNRKERRPSLEARYENVMQGECHRHDYCLECIMGVCNQTGIEEDVKYILQLPESISSLSTRALVAETYQHLSQSEVTYNNFHYLQQPNEDLVRTSSVYSASNLGQKLVTNTAEFLDHLSFMDANFPPVHDGNPKLSCHSNHGWWHARLKTSMLDLPREEEEQVSYNQRVLGSEIRSMLEVLSFSSCRMRCQRLWKQSAVEEIADEETGATKSGGDEQICAKDDIWPCSGSENTFRLRAQETLCPDVYPVVVRRLPLYVCCSHEAMTCDYLPIVRQICRSERWRQEAHLKRRFLHYLDYNAMSLKATDYLKLASALDVKPSHPSQEDSFLSAI